MKPQTIANHLYIIASAIENARHPSKSAVVKDINALVAAVTSPSGEIKLPAMEMVEYANGTVGPEMADYAFDDLSDAISDKLYSAKGFEARWVDVGIGQYEYWGAPGYHSQIDLEVEYPHDMDITIAFDKLPEESDTDAFAKEKRWMEDYVKYINEPRNAIISNHHVSEQYEDYDEDFNVKTYEDNLDVQIKWDAKIVRQEPGKCELLLTAVDHQVL